MMGSHRGILLSITFITLITYNDAFTTPKPQDRNILSYSWPTTEPKTTTATQSTTTDELPKIKQPKESRLEKANRILSELQLDYLDLEPLSSPEETSAVPDSFWRNAHLEGDSGSGQKYVTRWARGMKVAEPLRQYDPIATEKILFRQPAKWLIRNVQIAFPLGIWVLNLLGDFLTGQELKNRKERAKQLLQTISTLGPAIIKGGQALSSRPDLMPSEYLEALQKLQDDVPTYPNSKAFEIVEEELNASFSSLFELIEEQPIAAASIGQVYKARLLSNNATIALKIQRPQCETVISLDLYILRWWSGVANVLMRIFGRDINVQSIIDDFGVLIYRELDYVAEAANAQRFAELYSGEEVFVPKVYSDLTTSRVLVMEWVDGLRLTDSPSLTSFSLNKAHLLETLIQCSLRQILENGFFHADPHAGNLLATSDGRLCYLDFGMMSYAAENQRNGFLLAVVHIVNRDWGELVRLYVKLGFIPEGTDLRPIEVALEDAMPDVLNADVSELNFKNVINKLGDIMYTYPFSLPPFYIAIIRCLGVLEGLAIQVDPKTRVISEAYPYIASRVLTDSQEDFKEALRRLALTSDGHVRWGRLEGLLEEAKGTSGYDVTIAIDQLSAYLLSSEGESLLKEIADQTVEAADNLGVESITYIFQASRALSISDEESAVRAFRSLAAIFNRDQDQFREVLPEPSPAMVRFWRIASLLGAVGDGDSVDRAKFVPLVRKLAQEPKVQRTAGDIMARLGERVLSRGLRAAFGLSAPTFSGGGGLPVGIDKSDS